MFKPVLAVVFLSIAIWTFGQSTTPMSAPTSITLNQSDRSWIATSNRYTNLLIEITRKYAPEGASEQGLAEYDELISNPTLASENSRVAETKVAQAKIQAALSTEQNEYVKQDLQILLHNIDFNRKQQEFYEAHVVPYANASAYIFGGLRALLDDKVGPERRKAAVVRLRKYAGVEPGYLPMVDLFKARVEAQIAKPGMIYPPKEEVETALSRNGEYLDAIPALFKHYGLTGWEESWAKLKVQLAAYDEWTKQTILPKARADFRLSPEQYALSLEVFGVDISPGQLAVLAHQSFKVYQDEMQIIATQIAKQQGWPSIDYRDVIRRLKQDQLASDAILPFYKNRLHEIEAIIVKQNLVTLPDRPVRIRLGTPVENGAPHMVPPPFLNNTGQQGEFVLPLNMPAAVGLSQSQKVDDYTYDAASWTLIAHEARPGHELQFDSMVEQGVSLTREMYTLNSTNVEGWGVYSEYIMQPYMPLEGQLISLQFRLLRAARAYLDPELQAGLIQPKDAMRVLTEDVVFSAPFANQEIERYTLGAPGQATSYFYGFIKLLQLRSDIETMLGPRFDQKKFHDFVLSQGPLPPDLIRLAVMESFIPSQR